MRRSTVLSLPLCLVFPGINDDCFWWKDFSDFQPQLTFQNSTKFSILILEVFHYKTFRTANLFCSTVSSSVAHLNPCRIFAGNAGATGTYSLQMSVPYPTLVEPPSVTTLPANVSLRMTCIDMRTNLQCSISNYDHKNIYSTDSLRSWKRNPFWKKKLKFHKNKNLCFCSFFELVASSFFRKAQ